jgi:hypothetical protein
MERPRAANPLSGEPCRSGCVAHPFVLHRTITTGEQHLPGGTGHWVLDDDPRSRKASRASPASSDISAAFRSATAISGSSHSTQSSPTTPLQRKTGGGHWVNSCNRDIPSTSGRRWGSHGSPTLVRNRLSVSSRLFFKNSQTNIFLFESLVSLSSFHL